MLSVQLYIVMLSAIILSVVSPLLSTYEALPLLIFKTCGQKKIEDLILCQEKKTMSLVHFEWHHLFSKISTTKYLDLYFKHMILN
jgi:hypothetical protein